MAGSPPQGGSRHDSRDCRRHSSCNRGECAKRISATTNWPAQAMEYTKLGRTGLDVSRICLGCMSYGGGNLGNHAWSLPEEESRPFIKKALEAGINFFDTANRYSLGNSEEILGRAIKDFARRDEVVIATK